MRPITRPALEFTYGAQRKTLPITEDCFREYKDRTVDHVLSAVETLMLKSRDEQADMKAMIILAAACLQASNLACLLLEKMTERGGLFDRVALPKELAVSELIRECASPAGQEWYSGNFGQRARKYA